MLQSALFTLIKGYAMLFKSFQNPKKEFIARSCMTFAHFIATAALATRFFGNLTSSWRIGLAIVMFLLIVFSVQIFPNFSRGEK